jgi:hypothetical protein
LSRELIKRLTAYPALQVHLDKLQPKVFALSSDADATPIEVKAIELDVAADIERINQSKFTSKGDKPKVISLYKEYVHSTVGALEKTLGSLQMLTSHSEMVALAEPQPRVDAPAASPLRLAEGQPLLLLSWQGSGAGGGPRFGVVDATGGRVAAAVTGGEDVELAWDRCSQAVLPWRPPTAGWDVAFVGDARALRDLAEPARRLADDARRMESESALRAVGERARAIADGAAQCQSIAHAAREVGGAVQLCVDAVAALFSQSNPTQLQAALDKVRAAVERLQPEAMVTAALRSSGASGARCYAAGQPLIVRTAGGWRDADVATAGADGLCHRLKFEGPSGEPPATLTLHPWNHAPRELPHVAFEAMRAWWARSLRANHAHIADALTGKRLDTLLQCIAISVTGGAAETQVSAIRNANSLTAWLLEQHRAQLEGGPTEGPLAALLTAGPASGKTTLLSQVVMIALQDEHTELVPILVKVQVLQRRLLEAPDAFAGAWNYIDAFLRLEHKASRPALYRMLRQAMMARRALLLLDGLDEAGANRAEIEQHVLEVLAPQGHVMLCTSRPAGVVEARFSGFRLLRLAPLTEAQQEQALLQRLGNEGDVRQLMTFVERMPTSTDPDAPTMQHRVTANPLMLSMVASVFEIRKGLDMPKTVANLYESASDAMLARGRGVTAEVRTLLEVVFFEAHVAQARVITDVQLLRAALGAFAPPGTLADLDAKVVYPFQTFKGRPEEGHYVELLDGYHEGQRGVIVRDDKSRNPYKVKLADGATTSWLKPKQLASSGLDEAACLAQMARADAARLQLPALVDSAVQALRDEEQAAVAEVRQGVGQDRLPLLSLLQVEPLQMQSAHLSFQEFFAVQAICSGKYRLPEGSPPPWQWPAFWANAVTLGSEMGDAFGKGLKQTAGVGDELDLSQKLIGGDRPTMVAAVVQLMRGLASLSLRENQLNDGEASKMVEALHANTTLRRLDLGGNELGASGKGMVEALKTNTTFRTVTLESVVLSIAELTLLKNRFDIESATMLAKIGAERGIMFSGMRPDQTEAGFSNEDSWDKGLQPADAILIGSDLQFMAVLTTLHLNLNLIGDDGAKAIAEALKLNTVLTYLDMDINKIGDGGAKAIAEALKVNAVLTTLGLRFNNIGREGAIAISEALKVNRGLATLGLRFNKIGREGAIAISEALKVNSVLTILSLEANDIGDDGAKAIAEALKVNTVLTYLGMDINKIGDGSVKAIAEALKINKAIAKALKIKKAVQDAKIKKGEKDRRRFVFDYRGDDRRGMQALEVKLCVYRFRGGAPPYRGMHRHEDSDLTLSVAADRTVAAVVKSVITRLNLHRNIDFFIAPLGTVTPKQFWNEEEAAFEHVDVQDARPASGVLAGQKLVVMISMAPGAVDIGVWLRPAEPLAACSLVAADLPGAEWLAEPDFTERDASALRNAVKEVALCVSGRCGAAARSADGDVGDDDAAPVVPAEACAALVARVESAWRVSQDAPAAISPLLRAPAAGLHDAGLGASVAAGSRADDFKVMLSARELEEAVGAGPYAAILAALAGLREGGDGPLHEPDAVALRRTVATGRHIPFHTDRAARTVQVPLSGDDACVGGRLVVLGPDGRLHRPARRVGALLAHDGDVVHGVTRLDAGVRYGLFVLRAR